MSVTPVDPTQPYDSDNIFAKILRGEIPSTRVYEDEWAVAFEDIAPVAPIHVLVVPRGAYVSWDDFSQNAPAQEVAGYVKAIGNVARQLGLVEDGYRLINNIGPDGGQIVPHLHVHLLGGRTMGPMLTGQ
ncbi:histidine triad nucleotide-binding protein [Croceicoccus marinus]|uniref:Histidine triad nucleotide-binding protein n=1 Tax=Croceicoccus marinus TaxID=450378 RepID=A0A1Z1FC46_9SPHN|nr:histidine triad nucleotide-binding protein [Croceicoccus marinus]ARU16335.1 histidine triad nucleotide-binding protein [Croceicoccus marinus]